MGASVVCELYTEQSERVHQVAALLGPRLQHSTLKTFLIDCLCRMKIYNVVWESTRM